MESVNDWSRWRDRFARRAHRALPALTADHDYTQLPRSLARSLAVFQLGESGGGSIVDQAQRSDVPQIDGDYMEAMRLFVHEEHRHANILAMCVRVMGGRLIARNWTARLFVFGRRLMGLRSKVLVLLAAEVVGLCFYRLIAERLPPGTLRSWLLEIIEDERMHLDFHSEFLRRQVTGPVRRTLFVAAWRSLTWVAGGVVLFDHRETLRDLYIDRGKAWSSWWHLSREAEQAVLTDGLAIPDAQGQGVRT